MLKLAASCEFTICIKRNSGLFLEMFQSARINTEKRMLYYQALHFHGNECELWKQEQNCFPTLIGSQVMPASAGGTKL